MRLKIDTDPVWAEDTWKEPGSTGGKLYIRRNMATPGKAWFLIFRNDAEGTDQGTPIYFTADELDLLALRLTQIAQELRKS